MNIKSTWRFVFLFYECLLLLTPYHQIAWGNRFSKVISFLKWKIPLLSCICNVARFIKMSPLLSHGYAAHILLNLFVSFNLVWVITTNHTCILYYIIVLATNWSAVYSGFETRHHLILKCHSICLNFVNNRSCWTEFRYEVTIKLLRSCLIISCEWLIMLLIWQTWSTCTVLLKGSFKSKLLWLWYDWRTIWIWLLIHERIFMSLIILFKSCYRRSTEIIARWANLTLLAETFWFLICVVIIIVALWKYISSCSTIKTTINDLGSWSKSTRF